jgi:fatty-acid peroxygenase
MAQIPRDKGLDSTLALLFDGYRFISNRCRRYDSDLFETRLLLRKAICMRGAEAARLFYDNNRFKRQGGMPKRVQKTLTGEGGVQQLDGAAHRDRKQMFMSLMTPERIRMLTDLTAEQWQSYMEMWAKKGRVVLFHEVQELLCRAVCRWAGVSLPEPEVRQRTREMAAMIDGPAAIGPRYRRGRAARKSAEDWIGGLIDDVRAHRLEVPAGSAAHVIAWHRDGKDRLLDRRVAAVELLNILRPTVAVARFVVFAALALHEHREYRRQFQAHDDESLALFVQEVRRFYPFFPFVAAVVKKDFHWHGYRFPRGRWVILDLYGTNHDPRLWENPEAFQPERFRHWDGSAYDFIPQGGGDYYQGHRCAGEWITIALMKVMVRLLTTRMAYTVPEQDLRIDLWRVPAIPRSRFVISNVRLLG